MRNPLTEKIAVMHLFICKIKMIHCRNATMRVWIGGGGEGGRGTYVSQLNFWPFVSLSVKFKAFCQLSVKFFLFY